MDKLIDNSWRGRFNAWLLNIINDYVNNKLYWRKKKLFQSVVGSDIVEIGPGVGANFEFYESGARVVGVEPNVYMVDKLNRRARQFEIEFNHIYASAEDLPFEDSSVSSIVCTLVLCTVENPAKALAEFYRVLRPGGVFICIEHVCAEQNTFTHKLQKLLYKPWRYLFEGCEIDRRTDEHIKRVGFRELDIVHYHLDSVFYPVNSQISVLAIK